MAGCAGRGESSADVIWIGGRGVLRLMTAIAIRGRSRKNVVDVATRAGDGQMRACKWERGLGVIEDGARPRCGVVTGFACGGESGIDVIGIRGGSVLRLMAGVAVGWNGCVVVVDMTERACGCKVRSGQGE